jgi:hypothetical protein
MISTLCLGPLSKADQIVMQNGDILNGLVLTMSTNSVVLQDASLGIITLPRAKVSNIAFGAAAAQSTAASPANLVIIGHPGTVQTNSVSGLAAELRGIRSQTNLIEEVQAQILGASASPAAVDKFNELLDGLSTGKIDMNELRAEAQSATEQLQSFTNEMGPDSSEEAEGYLSILNSFLQESAPGNVSTN